MYHCLRRTRIAASFLSGLLALSLFAQQAMAIDFIAPQIEHKLATEQVPQGDDHLVTAKVTDDTAVASVIVHYREKGSRDFEPMLMQNLDGSSHYEALISGSSISAAGIEYFFEATDSSGNTLEMYGSDGEPFSVAVVQQEVSVVNRINISVPNGGKASQVNGQSADRSVLPIKKKNNNKTWLWVGLGIVAAAVIAGAASGGSGDSGDAPVSTPATGDLEVETPIPVN